ncbi:MAG TPA: SPFH domain-containing protein [Herpetosiphonaceae bacterium]
MYRLLPNLLLLLMLLFLLPVYAVTQSQTVLLLGIALLGAGFILVYTNQPRAIQVLAALTAVLSFVGVAFWGRLLTGSTNGGYCFVGAWILLLAAISVLLFQRAVFVERGQIIVINQLPENRALVWTEGLHRPLKPVVERRAAALPSYELDLEFFIENLNTKSLYNVDSVKVLVRYRVEQPREVVFCFPNREQACEQLARERGEPSPTDTDEQVAFWSELIRRQMLLEVEQSVRTEIANVTGPTDVAQDRETHARHTRQRLQNSVARWGIRVLDFRLLDVKISEYSIKLKYRDHRIRREVEDAQRLAEIRAKEVQAIGEAQAQATARLVAEMVRTLQQQGTTLTTNDIERIVITAMQRMSDHQQLSGFFRDVAQTSAPGSSQSTAPPSTNNPNQPPGS